MKTMPNSTQEEKYRWIKPILEGEITIKDMAKVCPFSERALKYWLAAYRKYGLAGLRTKKISVWEVIFPSLNAFSISGR